MKVLQKLIFTFAMVIGLTLAVSAQDDTKKPPPKDPPPVVTPQPKPSPPDSNKPKKPNYSLAIWMKEDSEIA